MTELNIIGFAMLALILPALFAYIWIIDGLKIAVKTFGIVAIIGGWVLLATFLVMN